MGLAASQARLLSITSRMSDTELRSQLINNAKMRLTSDSAKVSDEYIAALNQTQMMFTNFDVFGNERYQNLTFNALTAYSSYNNQYGIVNNNGELIVSELDANNFVASGGNVNNFLSLYGLEQTTSYWDTLAASSEFLQNGVGYYDNFGEWQQFDVTIDDLKAMYEGEVDSHGIDHYGLDASYNSVEYETYSSLVMAVNNTKSNYDTLMTQAKQEYLEGILGKEDDINTVTQANRFTNIYALSEAFGKFQELMCKQCSVNETTSYPPHLVQNGCGNFLFDFLYGYGMHQPFEQSYGNFNTTALLPGNLGSYTTISNQWGDPGHTYHVSGYGYTEATVALKYTQAIYRFMDLLHLGNGVANDDTQSLEGSFAEDQVKPAYWKPQSYFEDNDEFFSMLNESLERISIWLNATTIEDNQRKGVGWVYYENPEPGKCYKFVNLVLDSNGNWSLYENGGHNLLDPNNTSDYLHWSVNSDGSDTFIENYGAGHGSLDNWWNESGDHVLLHDSAQNHRFEPIYVRPPHAGETPDPNTGYVYTWPSKDDPYFSEAVPYLADCDPSVTGVLIKYDDIAVRDVTMMAEIVNVLNLLKTSASYLDEVKIREIGASEPTLHPEAAAANSAFAEYQEAATKLAMFIWGRDAGTAVANDMFGDSIHEKYYENLDDPTWILSQNPNSDSVHFNPYYSQNPTTTGLQDPAWMNLIGDAAEEYVSYQAVKDILLLECMLDHYGEPKYTWIDVYNPQENAEAKAQWYMNLFDRMQRGYQVIGQGLENSADWLQFAFESSLVHMEQVNNSNEWISTMYSNCSGITESTVAVDITLAEAKYKREMAKIEAKDKRYDMELKSIDTEHESLKQEYEQIKKVIKANIDRNMKMFQG